MKKLLYLTLLFSFYAVGQEDDADIPPEILQLEESFENADPPDEIKAAPEDPKELSQGVPVPKASEPGEDLPPSMMLYRVPLFPALSEANWRKYTGPDFTRIYNTKKGDSLWIISERLFGNPHLWPKIWQLNANVGNPHTIQRGLELSFTPGNPNASPHLAFVKRANSSDTFLPSLTGHVRNITVADKIREALTEEGNGFNRFRSFLIRNKPEILGKIPTAQRASYNILFEAGDRFALPNVPAGEYAIVRLRDPVVTNLGGQVLWWVGNISVNDSEGPEDKNARISNAFEAINPGDFIAVRSFAMEPLAVHTEFMGMDRRKEVRFVNVDTNLFTLSGEGYLMGARFTNDTSGPSLGGIVNIKRQNDWVATAVLIDRDRDLGTFWVVESGQEVLDSDYVE